MGVYLLGQISTTTVSPEMGICSVDIIYRNRGNLFPRFFDEYGIEQILQLSRIGHAVLVFIPLHVNKSMVHNEAFPFMHMQSILCEPISVISSLMGSRIIPITQKIQRTYGTFAS